MLLNWNSRKAEIALAEILAHVANLARQVINWIEEKSTLVKVQDRKTSFICNQ